MVHFPGFARARLWIHRAVREFCPRRFPHSEIPGSKPACGSPRLIAACHVLHRLLLPRHSPCALSSLTIKFTRHTLVRLRTRRANSMGLSCSSHARPRSRTEARRRTPAGFLSGTHKNYSLVDCPIYSVVKNRMARASLPAFPPRRDLSLSRAARRPSSNPRFGARQPAPPWRPTLCWMLVIAAENLDRCRAESSQFALGALEPTPQSRRSPPSRSP
jgi:hypothetical protein